MRLDEEKSFRVFRLIAVIFLVLIFLIDPQQFYEAALYILSNVRQVCIDVLPFMAAVAFVVFLKRTSRKG